MYLYLASNADGYLKELSCEAFKNATRKSKASYHRAVTALTDLGYIYEDSGGRLNFATKPKEGLRKAIQNWEEANSNLKTPSSKSELAKSQTCNSAKSKLNIEIDNRENKYNKEIDNTTSLSYLKEIISPISEYIGGPKKGKWLEDEITDFWHLLPDKLIDAIVSNTTFNESEAEYIVW